MPTALRAGYNPVDYASYGPSYNRRWLRVFRESRDLGAVQLGISGGEPLVRKDCETLVSESTKMILC